MAGTLKSLLVKLGVDSKDFDKGMDSAEGKTKHLEGTFDNLSKVGLGIMAGAAVGISAGAVALASTIAPATDLQESINAVNVVFGEGADEVLKFGENSATAVGLSSREFGQLSAEMGAMLGNVGIAENELAGETINLVERASDMASIFNKDVGQAFAAIQSAIKGEFNPLEAFGVKMNQAMINAKALEMGLADANGEINDAAKAQAALSLVYEQTDKVAGDFQNTADGLANSQRIMAAVVEDTKAKIGSGLTPALEGVAKTFKDIAASPEFEEFLDKVILGVTKLGDWITRTVPKMIKNFKAFKEFMANNKGIVVGVLAAMSVAVMAFGISVATAAWAALVPLLPMIAILLAVAGVAYLVYEAWTNNWGGIQEKTAAAIAFIVNLFNNFKTRAIEIWTAFISFIQPLIDAFTSAVEGDWYSFGENLRKAWDNIWSAISTAFTNFGIWMIETVIDLVTKVVNWFKETDWGAVGLSIIKGIAKGITSGVSWLKNAARKAAQAAFNAAKGFLGIHSPSTLFAGIGQNMMMGMATGISGSAQVPVTVTEKATKDIAQTAGNSGDSQTAGMMQQFMGQQILDESKLARMLRDLMLQVSD